MAGIIKTQTGVYVFRTDTGDSFVWAWSIYDLDRPVCHKWHSIPAGQVTLFDIDNPPTTVGYLPCLD